MPWHLARSWDLNYPSKHNVSKLNLNLSDYQSKRHAFKLDSNFSNYSSKCYAFKLDSKLSDYPSKQHASKLDSNFSDYPSERYTSKQGLKFLKCLSDIAQPSRLGFKKITTVFQSMLPYYPTLDLSNVLLIDQLFTKVALVDCLWV